MAKNIEIKAKIESLDKALEAAAALCGGKPECLIQEDTFYSNRNGRLKLRRMSPDQGQLIFYQRADQTGPKVSDYEIFGTDQPEALDRVLAEALGIRGTVKKRRWFFSADRFRIHVDDVEDLGPFIELEIIVSEDLSAGAAEKLVVDLMNRLGITSDQLVDTAYIDLLEV